MWSISQAINFPLKDEQKWHKMLKRISSRRLVPYNTISTSNKGKLNVVIKVILKFKTQNLPRQHASDSKVQHNRRENVKENSYAQVNNLECL